MRYTINLTTKTHLDHRLLNRLAYIGIVVILFITIWNISRVAANFGEQSRLNSEVAVIEGKLGAKPGGVSEKEYSNQKLRIRFFNEILERKSTNWLHSLEMFENATPDGISLSSLSPDLKRQEWKVEGRARSFKIVQQYLEKLEGSKNFSNVLLQSHQLIVTGEKGRGVQFAISCKVLNQ
jgi:hypothetical protein